MITIERAIEIANEAHKGQNDLEGQPYILHPLTVGLMGTTREEQITGFLHDVVEDTDTTFDDLLRMEVDAEIVDALRLLTHDKEKMTYREYVQNIILSGNRLAMSVKKNDLTHNIARGKKYGHMSLVKRHEEAIRAILEALSGKE